MVGLHAPLMRVPRHSDYTSDRLRPLSLSLLQTFCSCYLRAGTAGKGRVRLRPKNRYHSHGTFIGTEARQPAAAMLNQLSPELLILVLSELSLPDLLTCERVGQIQLFLLQWEDLLRNITYSKCYRSIAVSNPSSKKPLYFNILSN